MNTLTVDHFCNISFADPQENIIYDDVLLSLAEQQQLGNTLRIWESSVPFIVLGRTSKWEDDLRIPAIKTDRIPVLRRSSGGGTVMQGPGCFNFSLIISKQNDKDLADLRKSYQVILQEVLILLQGMGVNAVFRPISDLALVDQEKKFSGNAQRRGRKFILHHGTILYHFDLHLISRYLTIPVDIPAYRNRRPHADFITNIPVTFSQLAAGFRNSFAASHCRISASITPTESELVHTMRQTRSVLIKF